MHFIFLHVTRVKAQAFSDTGSREIWSRVLSMLQRACVLLRDLITCVFCFSVSYRAKVDNFCTAQDRVPVTHEPPVVLSPAGMYGAEAF